MKILFLCTGNSARSILGEIIFNDLFADHGHACSAGSRPAGQVDPAALVVLQKYGHNIQGLCSKSVDESEVSVDLVISVCDNAAQACPVWPGEGAPKHLHWPLPDPAAVAGNTEKAAAFENTYQDLKERISALVATL